MAIAAAGWTTLLLSSALVISTLALPGAARAQSYRTEAVVLEGDAAPGGGFYADLSTVAVETNGAGDVAFRADLTGAPAGSAIILSSSDGTEAAVVLEGDAAPGTGGGSFDVLLPFSTSLNALGDVAFRSRILGGTTLLGIFTHSNGVTLPVALDGGPTFRLGGMLASQNPINASGEVAFQSGTGGGFNPSAPWTILLDSAGTLTTIATEPGDPAPGTGGGSYAFPLGAGPMRISLSDAGEVAFSAAVSGGNVTGGLFAGTGGSDRAVAFDGDMAPDTGGGVYHRLALVTSPQINAAGDVSFRAQVLGGTVPQSGFAHQGVFLHTGPVSRSIALAGEPVPGTGGGTYAGFGSPITRTRLNADGDVAFFSDVSGGSVDHGIFAHADGATAPVALPGQSAPGTGGGRFLELGELFALNDRGDVVFAASISDGDVASGIFRARRVHGVVIDIVPGNPANPVPVMAGGIVRVAVLGSPDLDVAALDQASLVFGPLAASPLPGRPARAGGPAASPDLNGDGTPDLVTAFRIPDTGIAAGDTQACLTGQLLDRTPIEGCDFVWTVPACGLGFELVLLIPPLLWLRRRCAPALQRYGASPAKNRRGLSTSS